MTGLSHLWAQGDFISKSVAALLLLMSIGAWVVILWKGWMLARARNDLTRGVPAFWRALDLASARQALQSVDREAVLLPLVDAAQVTSQPGSLEAQVQPEAQLTRRLRDSLHEVLARLQAGQVLLASVGAVAPFVGLLGTVWGIYHAMMGISNDGSVSLDKVAGPVGEALIMTAAGLAVAIPAVLAYNIFGKVVSACEADLEGFAHDLREAVLGHPARGSGPDA
jgi:biopolymer transport protein ExbB